MAAVFFADAFGPIRCLAALSISSKLCSGWGGANFPDGIIANDVCSSPLPSI